MPSSISGTEIVGGDGAVTGGGDDEVRIERRVWGKGGSEDSKSGV